MIVRSSHIITLPSGNLARDFRWVSVEASKLAEDDTSGLMDTLKVVGGMVMINIIVTLATLGIVWYNL